MSEETTIDPPVTEPPPPVVTPPVVEPPIEDLEKRIQDAVAAKLKDIKGKLDNAYSSRDDALKKLAIFEQKEREAELLRLNEEGKFKEAFDLQLAQERAKIEALQARNIELTRDIEVKNALSSLPFKNESAARMAYRTIVSELVQNEDGVWVHQSGGSIEDYVKIFSEQNNFLLEQKVSTGPGVTQTKGTSPPTTTKSIFDMSQEDVLKLALEGKLPRR